MFRSVAAKVTRYLKDGKLRANYPEMPATIRTAKGKETKAFEEQDAARRWFGLGGVVLGSWVLRIGTCGVAAGGRDARR